MRAEEFAVNFLVAFVLTYVYLRGLVWACKRARWIQ